MILSVSWEYVAMADECNSMVDRLDTMVEEMVNIAFPEVKLRMNNYDLPYITAELKRMDRVKKREYKKYGRSVRFGELNREYKSKLKEMRTLSTLIITYTEYHEER